MTGTDAFARLLPSLLVLGAAVVGLRWWLRRQGAPGQQLVRVVSRTGLSRGALLAVVQAGERKLLLGVTDSQINLLAELPQDAALDVTDFAGVSGGDGGPAATDAAGLSSALRGNAGPRMGMVDRLREMTVRSAPPRPPRARP